MKDLMNPFKAYQIAKAEFAKLHWGSQPNSLTRRGDTLIVRRSYPLHYPIEARWLKDELETLVRRVIPEATIIESSVNGKNVRVRFQMLDNDFCEFLRETRENLEDFH